MTNKSITSDHSHITKHEQVVQGSSVASKWLIWQCEMISGVIQGAIYIPGNLQLGSAQVLWPIDGHVESLLLEASNEVKNTGAGVKLSKLSYGPNLQRLCDVVASPIIKEGQVTAIVAISLSVRSEAQQQAVLQLVRWGGLWLDTLIEREQRFTEKRNEYILTLSSSVARQSNVNTAAIEAVNRLEKCAGCSRVSLGIRENLKTTVRAVSNTPEFDSRSPLITLIENAMEESIDQETSLVIPQGPLDGHVSSAHHALSKHTSVQNILSLPLKYKSEYLGALTFERCDGDEFDLDTIKYLSSIATLLSSTFAHKVLLEKPLRTKLLAKLNNSSNYTAERSFSKTKLAGVAVLGLIVIANIYHSPYSVKAPSIIEGAKRQLIAAPMNGYIKTAAVRVGDTVKSGQALAILDSQRLRLEKRRFTSQKNQITHLYQTAIATQDRTELAKLNAKIEQIDSDISLVNNQLERTTLAAPFSGVVLSGDLSQSLGSPVELGQVLFEVAPLEDYRVILEVPERDIQHISPGQQGRLVVTALPDKNFKFEVDSISPLANSNSSGNFFMVEANLIEKSEILLPGMSGIARIQSVEKSIWWIWTHKLVNKVTLFFWSIGVS